MFAFFICLLLTVRQISDNVGKSVCLTFLISSSVAEKGLSRFEIIEENCFSMAFFINYFLLISA